MISEDQALRWATAGLRWICRDLPIDFRDELYLELAAELPAILADQDVKVTLLRQVRAARFVLGQRKTVVYHCPELGLLRRIDPPILFPS